MKKCCLILLLGMLLSGCSDTQTMETLGDIDMTPVLREERGMHIDIADDADMIRGETGTIYLCDGYVVTVEILDGGNINKTFQTLTGHECDDLTVIETATAEVNRYECVWTAAGEGGDAVSRAGVMDDGIFHYCVTVSADADDAAALQETWKQILDSIQLT